MNFKIFPAHLNSEGQKVPLIKNWQTLASNDPAQIKLWQELFRERITFWGVPCGQVNGIYVLDIDVKKVNGWDSLKSLGYQLPNTLRQDTPSGGSHFFFKTEPGVHYQNTVNQKLGLDTRGDGGWIAFYNFVNNEPLLEAPSWMFELSKPKIDAVALPINPITIAPEIAQAIFQTSLDAIRNAPAGESNDTLNKESFKVGQLVASQSITRQFAEEELFKAAKDRGKPDYESRATIKSGLDGGIKSPISSPFSEPVPAFEIPLLPPPPEAPVRWTPTFLTRHDLLNTSKLRKPQLFRDWSTEDIQITTADGGTGKTTMKLLEAICLALGDPFLGFACVQRGRTLFITGEDTDKKLAAMLGAIMKQMGLLDGSPENNAKVDTILQSIIIKKDADLCLVTKDKQNFLVPSVQALDKVMQAVEDFKPKMIVFDPISSFWGPESALNDMNRAVIKFMSALVEKELCVEMINHMGKSSSASKDMTQFSGRGGSGLPSNSRVSRTLRGLPADEFQELTGGDLFGDQTAMLCQVNKFSDGSSLLNKPFIIVREGFLFRRMNLSPAKVKEMENSMSDNERVFTWVKEMRSKNKYPTRKIVIGHFMNCGDPLSAARTTRALDSIEFFGHMGEKFSQVDNPDLTKNDKVIIIVDAIEGREA